jgi:hypothetical protein
MTALPDGWTEDRDGTERIRTLMERPGALRVVGAFHHRDGRVAILTRDNIGEPSAHDWLCPAPIPVDERPRPRASP